MFHMKHNLEKGVGPEILEPGGIAYMTDADIQGMSDYGDTFAEALEHFLNYLPDFGLGPVHFTESRMARFQSEAATLPELVLKAREAVAALAAEFDLSVARVSVDGHRPIEGGHRCWGTIELAQYAETDDPVQIIDGPYVTWDPVACHWRIDVSFIDD